MGGEHGPCVRAFIYLWRSAVPAVVFDIDGTVSVNDIAGQAAMLLDVSPTHAGVCELLALGHKELVEAGPLAAYLGGPRAQHPHPPC